MAGNGIRWSKRALKQLRKLPITDASRVYEAAGALKAFPDCANVKRLNNHQYAYRLRAGRYRLMFNYDGDVKIVSIEEVRKRDEATY